MKLKEEAKSSTISLVYSLLFSIHVWEIWWTNLKLLSLILLASSRYYYLAGIAQTAKASGYGNALLLSRIKSDQLP